MATKKELAEGYLERIMKNKFSAESIRTIIDEIKNLKFEESGTFISISDRVEIVKNIEELIVERGLNRGIQGYSSGGKLSEQRSNDEFLDLIDYVLNQVKK